MATEHNGEIPLSGSGFEEEIPVKIEDLGAIPLEGSGFEDEEAESGGVQ